MAYEPRWDYHSDHTVLQASVHLQVLSVKWHIGRNTYLIHILQAIHLYHLPQSVRFLTCQTPRNLLWLYDFSRHSRLNICIYFIQYICSVMWDPPIQHYIHLMPGFTAPHRIADLMILKTKFLIHLNLIRKAGQNQLLSSLCSWSFAEYWCKRAQ